MKLVAFIEKEREVFLIKVGGKLKAAEEVFALRCCLNGIEIYSKSPKEIRKIKNHNKCALSSLSKNLECLLQIIDLIKFSSKLYFLHFEIFSSG
jgi:hypothetical protein